MQRLKGSAMTLFHWLGKGDNEQKEWLTDWLTALPPTLLTRQSASWRCHKVKYKHRQRRLTQALFELKMNCKSTSGFFKMTLPHKNQSAQTYQEDSVIGPVWQNQHVVQPVTQNDDVGKLESFDVLPQVIKVTFHSIQRHFFHLFKFNRLD